MLSIVNRSLALGLGAALVLGAFPASSITLDPFGPLGSGGLASGQFFEAGLGTEIYEIDSYLNVAGEDLNGASSGTSGRLGADPLNGFDVSFASALSDSNTDITLTYTIERTGASVGGVQFLSYVDPQIDDLFNGFFNESAMTSGTLAAGQSFEIDEPFFSGDIFDNVMAGTLDSTNVFEGSDALDDVSMALSFDLGPLGTGDSATIEIMLSEDGDGIGSWLMTQTDADIGSTDTLSYSGRATVDVLEELLTEPAGSSVSLDAEAEAGMGSGSGEAPQSAVPEPSAALVFALGAMIASRATRQGR